MSPTRFSPLHRTLNLLAVAMLCAACTSAKVDDTDAPAAAKSKETREAAKGGAGAKAATKGAAASAPLDKAAQELASGIASYENGTYKASARQLQSALSMGLEAPADKARAHKYLAFMHCVSNRQKQCRDEFGNALDADPSFDLTPAEAGHPLWGPVFRKLKAPAKPKAVRK